MVITARELRAPTITYKGPRCVFPDHDLKREA